MSEATPLSQDEIDALLSDEGIEHDEEEAEPAEAAEDAAPEPVDEKEEALRLAAEEMGLDFDEVKRRVTLGADFAELISESETAEDEDDDDSEELSPAELADELAESLLALFETKTNAEMPATAGGQLAIYYALVVVAEKVAELTEAVKEQGVAIAQAAPRKRARGLSAATATQGGNGTKNPVPVDAARATVNDPSLDSSGFHRAGQAGWR